MESKLLNAFGKILPVQVIFATQNNDADIRIEALASGADGYLLKANAASELLPAIEAALKNGHSPDAPFHTEQEKHRF